MKNIWISLLVVFALTTGFAGCGSSSSDNDSVPALSGSTVEITGKFIDSEVEGLSYICNPSGLTGFTNASGQYTCLEAEEVSFYLGDLLLGTVSVADVITPSMLFPDNEQAAVNLARLLQTLDSDNNPDNGITIEAEDLEQFADAVLDFTSDSYEEEAQELIAEVLVAEDDAREHLDESMASLRPILSTDNFGGTTEIFSFTEPTSTLTAACVSRYGEGSRVANWNELNDFILFHPNDVPTLLSNFFMEVDEDKIFINHLDAQWSDNGRYMINRETASDIEFLELNDDTHRGVACYIPSAIEEDAVIVEPEEECENPKIIGDLVHLDIPFVEAEAHCESIGGRLPTIGELENIFNAHGQEPPYGYGSENDGFFRYWSTTSAPTNEYNEELLYAAYLFSGEFEQISFNIDSSNAVMCVENTCYDEPQIIVTPEEEADAQGVATLSNFGVTSAVSLFSFTEGTEAISSNCVEMHGEGSRAANWDELNEFMLSEPNSVYRLIENFQMNVDGDKIFINHLDEQWGDNGRYMINRLTASDIEFLVLNNDTHRKAVCYIP